MNKQELEHKLTGAKLVLARHEHKKSQIEKNIKRFEVQLAEADKPKLRQWDCGINSCGKQTICITRDTRLIESTEDGLTDCETVDIHRKKYRWPAVFNLNDIFDDLKAIAEPLESFKVQCRCLGSDVLRISLDKKDTRKNGRIIFSLCHETVYTNKDYLHEFILNLRRLEAFINKEKS